jgi:hypothetical protein
MTTTFSAETVSQPLFNPGGHCPKCGHEVLSVRDVVCLTCEYTPACPEDGKWCFEHMTRSRARCAKRVGMS